jgi:hypothetical protein
MPADAGPLSTSMLSMSCTLMSDRLPFVITPSTMRSGACVAPGDSEVAERRRTVVSPPGTPEPVATRAPETLPVSADTGLSAGTSWICASSTRPTAKPSLRVDVASATPVTTTSFRRSGSCASWKFSVSVAPGVTVTVRVIGVKPMKRAVSRTGRPVARAGTTNE